MAHEVGTKGKSQGCEGTIHEYSALISKSTLYRLQYLQYQIH